MYIVYIMDVGRDESICLGIILLSVLNKNNFFF